MKHIIALFAGALAIGCYAQALAQELPKEGKYSITYTSVNPSPTKAVSIGDRDISVSSSIMTALKGQRPSAQHGRPLQLHVRNQ